MNYNMSFGSELELSDIDRSIDIPVELGRWEGPKVNGYYMGSEIDIVNTLGENFGKGTDPLAEDPKVGGEINTQPSYSPETHLNRVLDIFDLFPVVEVGSVNHTHVHCFIPGLAQNVELLKKVFEYTEINEKDMMRACYGWTADIDRRAKEDFPEWVYNYLHYDGCRKINPELYRAVEKVNTIDELHEALYNYNCMEYDWVTDTETVCKSHRTALNLFNLVKGDTIEFRCFRATLDPYELYCSFAFIKRYMEEALKGKNGKPVTEILKENNYRFAPFIYDKEAILGWSRTRQTKERGEAYKHYSGTVKPSDYIKHDYSTLISQIKEKFNGSAD